MDEKHLVRFFSKIEQNENGCWVWQGATGGSGKHRYGTLSNNGKLTLAHRLSYEHFIGPIPEGLNIDHLCQNKLCVNPGHLEPVTQHTNLHRSPNTLNAQNAALTHCKSGHLLSGDNVRFYRSQRVCRACKKEWVQQKRARI